MAKLPYFEFYVGDWSKDPNLRRCTKAEKGFLIEALCVLHENEDRGVFATGGVAWSHEEIAFAVGGDAAENLALLDAVLSKDVLKVNGQGAVYSRRMVRDEETRQARRKAGASGGKQKAKQNSSKTLANGVAKFKQISEDEDSLSLSSEDGEVQERKGPKRSNAPPDDWAGLPAELDCEPFKQEWLSYLASRRENGHKPLGRTNVLTKWKTLAGHGTRLAIAIVRKSTEEGWAGFFPDQVSLADADKVAASNKPPPNAPLPEPAWDWQKAAMDAGLYKPKDWRKIKWADLYPLHRSVQEEILALQVCGGAHN